MKKLYPLFVAGIAALLACSCAHVQKTIPPTVQFSDNQKIELRNNSASLLADLLGDEKNVSKVLIVKSNTKELGQLIKAISLVAGDAEKQLKLLAEHDPTLNLKSLELPTGEKAARDAVAKTKQHELLFTSGEEFEFNLLLTQAEALSYGAHLAKVAAENSPLPEQAREFHALDIALTDLFQQVVKRMRSLPVK